MKESEGALNEAVRAHTELRAFIETALQGLGWATEATRVHEVLKRYADRLADSEERERDRQRAERAEAFALEQAPKGFPYLWYLAAVRLWTILEVLVDDWALERLTNLDSIPSGSILHTLEGPLLPFAEASPELRSAMLLDLLKEKTRARFKPGIGRFEALLEPIGLSGPVADDVRKVLLELSEVRHLVVHRNGIVDKRFASACPWIGATVGNPLPLTQRHDVMYGLATDWYILELDRRELALSGDSAAKDVEIQNRLEHDLREILKSRPIGV